MSRTKPTPLKGDKRYKDAPRYKAIFGYEDEYRAGFKREIENMTKAMAKTLASFAKQKK